MWSATLLSFISIKSKTVALSGNWVFVCATVFTLAIFDTNKDKP